MRRLALLALAMLTTACSVMPDLREARSTSTAQQGWPELVPIGPVIAQARQTTTAPDPVAAEAARAAALRVRAAALLATTP